MPEHALEIKFLHLLTEILAVLEAQLTVERRTLQVAEQTLTVSQESRDALLRIEQLLTPQPRPASIAVTYARRLMAPNSLRVSYKTTLTPTN